MPPVLMLHTPAQVVRKYLLDAGLVEDLPDNPAVDPDTLPDWVVYAHKLRAEGTPDNAVAVINTSPVKDGRDLRAGEVKYHHGVQIMVRSLDEETGHLKCTNLERYLSQSTHGQTVTLDATAYLIEGFSVVSGTTFAGEEEQSERQFHTLNGKIAYRVT